MVISDENLEGRFSMQSEGGEEIDEMPFHLLVIGDWSGDAEKRDVAARRPIEIDRDNFDEVLSKISPSVRLEVNGNPFNLTFSKLDDFHPDQIFEQVSMFSELRDLRNRLRNSSSFNEAAREVRSWFPQQSTNSPSPNSETDSPVPASDDLLGQILSEPHGSAPRSKQSSGELAGLISELVRPHLLNVDEDEQSKLVAAVDAATGELMRGVLHDGRFQAVEAAWRGLYFLIRRAETETNLKIFVFNISKGELTDDLKTTDLSDSIFYKVLVRDTVETPGSDEWAAVIANYAFLPTVDDIAALVRISKICLAANAPFISHMRPDVLGIHALDGHTDPQEWNLGGNTDAGKLWSTLRSMSESAYLGMTIPRFLGRLPYGSEWDTIDTFAFEEFDNLPDHSSYLWINSCFACGTLLVQSFTENGWEMGGGRFMQDLQRLPLYVYEADGETVYQPCAEVQLTHDACDKLMEFGLMPLVSYKNTDHVKLARFQSITEPVTGLHGKWKRG